ncbi:hypothetical protein ADL35_07060, partial [Streptomyces sp. NRRL WC-3753]
MDLTALLSATPGAVAALLGNIAEALVQGALPLLPVTQLPLEHLAREAPSGRSTAYRWPTGTVTAHLPPDRVPLVRRVGRVRHDSPRRLPPSSTSKGSE